MEDVSNLGKASQNLGHDVVKYKHSKVWQITPELVALKPLFDDHAAQASSFSNPNVLSWTCAPWALGIVERKR